MFHPGDMEKKVRAFPWNTAQGKKRRRQAGCCFLSIPIGPLLRRTSVFQPRNSWRSGISGKERSRTASHSDIRHWEGGFSEDCAKAKVTLTLPGCFSQMSSLPEACPDPLLLCTPAPGAPCSPNNALTLGGSCLSPHYAGTGAMWEAFNTWSGIIA